MKLRPRAWPVIGGMILLWITVGGLLIYTYVTDRIDPDMIPSQRQTRLLDLGATGAAFIVYNGLKTAMRLRRIKNDEREEERETRKGLKAE